MSPPTETACFRRELENFVNAQRGARLVYHIGNLARDRKPGEPGDAVHAIGTAALRLYENGTISLTQRRRGPDDYLYIAERRRWRT
jgi:hypothetical protein